jgi:hypothetical protein
MGEIVFNLIDAPSHSSLAGRFLLGAKLQMRADVFVSVRDAPPYPRFKHRLQGRGKKEKRVILFAYSQKESKCFLKRETASSSS